MQRSNAGILAMIDRILRVLSADDTTLLPGSIGVACGVVRWSESFSSLVAPCRVPRNGVMEASATAARDNKPEMAHSNRPRGPWRRGENGLVNGRRPSDLGQVLRAAHDTGHEALL
eukprot:COSAG02_NODE_12035_length_1609_cov_1.443794_2_plen_116_part_00